MPCTCHGGSSESLASSPIRGAVQTQWQPEAPQQRVDQDHEHHFPAATKNRKTTTTARTPATVSQRVVCSQPGNLSESLLGALSGLWANQAMPLFRDSFQHAASLTSSVKSQSMWIDLFRCAVVSLLWCMFSRDPMKLRPKSIHVRVARD